MSREKKKHHFDTPYIFWGAAGIFVKLFYFFCSLLSDLAKRIYIPRDEISNSEWSVKRGGRILMLTVMFSRRIFVVNTIWKKINIDNYVWIAKCTLQSSFQFISISLHDSLCYLISFSLFQSLHVYSKSFYSNLSFHWK